MELAEALNDVLSAKWGKLRGIEIVSFGVSSVKASEEDEQMLKEMQRNAAFMDPTRAAAHLVGAQASAMQTAAGNQGAGPAKMCIRDRRRPWACTCAGDYPAAQRHRYS